MGSRILLRVLDLVVLVVRMVLRKRIMRELYLEVVKELHGLVSSCRLKREKENTFLCFLIREC